MEMNMDMDMLLLIDIDRDMYTCTYICKHVCVFKSGAAPKTETSNNLRRFAASFYILHGISRTPHENRPESPRQMRCKNSLAKICYRKRERD